MTREAERLMPTIASLSRGPFDMDTFLAQNARLVQMLEAFDRRLPRELGGTKDGKTKSSKAASEPAPERSSEPTARADDGLITIDLGRDSRTVTSLKLKVEFE